MRFLSAAQIKASAGIKRQRGGSATHDYPDPCSKAGIVLAVLMENKGIPIQLSYRDFGFRKAADMSMAIRRLTDFYGMDIRVVKRGTGNRWGPGKRSVFVLAGEWVGKIYVDYIAERMGEHGDSHGS